MIRQIWPLSALLLGTAFLLFAGGINGLILPVRGTAEGFSALSLGLLGTGWAVGYVSGCVITPRTVGRVGHIRTFAALCAFASVTILASLIFITPWAWIPLRAICGFCFAGAAMIVESWLSERVEPESRGRIFGIYTMINLGASTAGQLTLIAGGTEGFLFFVVGAIFYSLAMVPTAISSTSTPRPLVQVNLNIRALWLNSPLAVVAVFLVGISNSAFGTLAAVYGSEVGLTLTAIALFSSIPVMAGAIAQIPVGQLSDRMDRRKVLLGIAFIGICADLAFIVVHPESQLVNLVLASIFGAAIFSMYPVIVAHANDHAEPGTYIQVSGGLLLVLGIGSIVGPLIAGALMSAAGSSGLFYTTIVAHVLIIAYGIWRIRRRSAVRGRDKTEFVSISPTRTSTPETGVFTTTPDEYSEETTLSATDAPDGTPANKP